MCSQIFFIHFSLTNLYVSAAIFRGKIKLVVKNVFFYRKCDSTNHRLVIRSNNLIKVFEFCQISSLTKHFPIHCNQFDCRRGSICLSAVTSERKTVYCYVSEGSNVRCAMVDVSKVLWEAP